jgi:hypothetical protein
MGTEKPPLIVLVRGTSIWRDVRFLRWWDMTDVVCCAMAAGFLTMWAGQRLMSRFYHLGHDSFAPEPLNRWVVAAMAGMFSIAAYVVFRFLLHMYSERESSVEQPRKSGVESSTSVEKDAEQVLFRRKIAETFLRPDGRRIGNIGDAVRMYDAMHAEAGLMEQRASLLIEDGRSDALLWKRRSLPEVGTLIDRACTEAMTGEVEPLTQVNRPRLSTILMLIGVCVLLYFVKPRRVMFNMMTGWTPGNVWMIIMFDAVMFGWLIWCVVIICYSGLREQGLFPIPMWRGECSIEKTRVFHRFRWKTFHSGRDLAILRFTSDCEADIAFLGANGSYAITRVGGMYLNHFIACWSSSCRVVASQPSATTSDRMERRGIKGSGGR